MTSPIPVQFAPKKILLIKLRHHGDMLLTTPVINALHQHYPQASIDVLLYKETRPMLEAHPSVRHLHIIDRNWKKEGGWQTFRHEVALVSAVRACHYDLVINLADQWRSAILTGLSGAPVRIGFAFKKRDNAFWRGCHNHLVTTENHERLHTVEQNLSALSPLQISADGARASMHFSPDDALKVQNMLLQQQVKPPYIVLQPTSRWQFKCWEEDKVAATIDQLAQADRKVILTAGPDDSELAMVERILAQCQSPHVISLAGKLSLPQLAALIARAQLFIGVDSAPMHMAAALDTPCIALFGPTKLQHWRPWGDNNRVIWAGDYGPLPSPDSIDTRTEQRYLSVIPVEDVVTAARSYLNE
ncbi:putative lipopolysaccharide heptosyltransferase III [Pantoea ananatis]|jgi:heptosyltransferase-3|uniref:putative lipopolysaccharide heptosyltransferase III n=1 Tax=Pantoea ananas TaxID=553 RepID=UPI00099BBFC9|nr:putative lipopolysaccharide heptosyltransferase III [Pantoea ananatis]PQK94725.1 putative lipopolysaccharide heptosyltransferase III [Pantoea ananatis]PVY82276.1 heptosyltransferase-3 [Pantoea ananatis]TDL48681.1 putative lipopolysaccharide heptosyltransferase III [Pantoea ananatis]SKA88293.1 heptosyltransferase-3 [Pantoea ananatis]